MPWFEPLFQDRGEAGRRLAGKLMHLKDRRPVVMALPRGGVPVGFEVARALECPLDVLLVRKLGAPGNPEFAIGAVVDRADAGVYLNREVIDGFGIPDAYVEREIRDQLAEVERRRTVYRGRRPAVPVAGRAAIVVDDGVATGATVRVALRALRGAGPERLVLATPVAPADTVRSLEGECDEIVTVETPADFGALGRFYADFRQLEDAEVVDLLDRAASSGWA